jgi:hypothetical protein
MQNENAILDFTERNAPHHHHHSMLYHEKFPFSLFPLAVQKKASFTHNDVKLKGRRIRRRKSRNEVVRIRELYGGEGGECGVK